MRYPKLDMLAIEAFNRLGSVYDTWYATPLGAFVDAQEKAAVFALAEVRAGELALDVGCGTGNYTLELARRLEQGSGDPFFGAFLVARVR